MSYQMIHMEVAYKLLEHITQVENAAEFILGSVAPDSVHMDPNYNVNMKIKSHMFEGCGKWGDTQDYQQWNSNIYSVFRVAFAEEERTDYRDFLLGLCVHWLTDYWNDIKIWKKLQKEYIPPMNFEEFRDVYYQEARDIDRWLYKNSKNTEAIREMLANSKVFDVDGLVNKESVEKQRNHLLNVQYDIDTVDISKFQFLSASTIENFIDSVVNDIAKTIQSWQRTTA